MAEDLGDNTFDPFGLLVTEEARRSEIYADVKEYATAAAATPPVIRSADSFDPFGIAELQEQSSKEARGGVATSASVATTVESPKPPPAVSRVTRSGIALPPKLLVHLAIHEEVASTAKRGRERDGSSDVIVDGTIYAKVQCSDAIQNAPFVIRAHDLQIPVKPNPVYATSSDQLHKVIVQIPKHELGFVAVAHYSFAGEIEHMPILLERKVSIHETACRVALQVRSKLTNQADMDEFTLAVAVPERVDVASLEILRGQGEWDDLKRTVMWKLESLKKGESFMVSAQARFEKALENGEEVCFPVLLRCSSSGDQITSLDFEVEEAEGHASSLSSQTTHSFRLLHRLQ